MATYTKVELFSGIGRFHLQLALRGYRLGYSGLVIVPSGDIRVFPQAKIEELCTHEKTKSYTCPLISKACSPCTEFFELELYLVLQNTSQKALQEWFHLNTENYSSSLLLFYNSNKRYTYIKRLHVTICQPKPINISPLQKQFY